MILFCLSVHDTKPQEDKNIKKYKLAKISLQCFTYEAKSRN